MIRLLNEVASSKNWQGAFAELTAVDCFNYPLTESPSFLRSPVSIGVSPTDCTLLGELLGRQCGRSVLDGAFPDFDLYFDTKILQNTAKDILDGIHTRILAEFPGEQILIASEFDSDSGPWMFSDRVPDIEKELRKALRASPRITSFRSSVLTGLSHRIQWGPGTIISESGYNPYKHAREFWPFIFSDCHQFVTDKPFLLVYVIFPWYNNIVRPFAGLNQVFYRSVSRRVFCNPCCDRTLLATLLGPQKVAERLSGITVGEASRSLSGLLFLEDNCITSGKPAGSNTCGYLYANPNASNRLTKSLFWDYVACDLHPSQSDTFEFDNY